PNIVLIITDDQDLHLNSLSYQPALQKHLGAQGTTFNKHYCTISVCCPSRVNLLTGRMAHNTNVTDLSPPYGGYPIFLAQGLNDNYLPVWLQAGGYNTYYTGKLMNGHSVDLWNNPYPAGWNGTGFLLDYSTYFYHNSEFQEDQTSPVARPEYSTDVIRDYALGFLDKATNAGGPFFIGVAPIAPHSRLNYRNDTGRAYFDAAVPADRHKDLYPHVQVPRGANFNPDMPSGASWVSQLPKLNDSEIEYMDTFYRARLQSLAAVDELVDAVVNRIEALGISDNTYIIYTSDNGYHIAQHRLQPGKTCAYEEDINIPFLIRGPGIPKNKTVDFVTSHTDIAPTLLKLAGIDLRDEFDGIPMPLTVQEMDQAISSPLHDHVALEFWGDGIGEGDFANEGVGGARYKNNTYKALRVIGDDYSLAYTVWCTNEHELYDMMKDPEQMDNLATNIGGSLMGHALNQVTARLDALMMVMKSCKSAQCTTPWSTLHPKGDVNTLTDALDPKYDAFYSRQPKVSFTSCEPGYIISAEGPQVPLLYRTGNWNDWY
ncbi:alkaline-phosphatase-like protein, partial [Cadophora sp. MPI-SDFR-AT-0126]